MSFEIFVCGLSGDEADKFDRAIVVRAFRLAVPNPTGNHWNAHSPDGEMSHAEVLIRDDDAI
jgi:hypothetical protein